MVEQDPESDLLTINGEFTASVVMVRCLTDTRLDRVRWQIRFDVGLWPDITVAVRMDEPNQSALDYYLLPRIDMTAPNVRLAEDNGVSLDAYRFETLDAFFALGGSRARCRRLHERPLRAPSDRDDPYRPRHRDQSARSQQADVRGDRIEHRRDRSEAADHGDPREDPDGARYDLVCGQGRLEAYQALGQHEIPAIVVEADTEDCMVMSLVENLARRQHRAIDLLHDIEGLKKRGYNETEIAAKTGLTIEYVRGVLRLLKHGEHRLLRAVEAGQIPVSVAVEIAAAPTMRRPGRPPAGL